MVPRAQEIEFKALEGSLSMMSKVLNDVLDFNRMDSGRFESVFKVIPLLPPRVFFCISTHDVTTL